MSGAAVSINVFVNAFGTEKDIVSTMGCYTSMLKESFWYKIGCAVCSLAGVGVPLVAKKFFEQSSLRCASVGAPLLGIAIYLYWQGSVHDAEAVQEKISQLNLLKRAKNFFETTCDSMQDLIFKMARDKFDVDQSKKAYKSSDIAKNVLLEEVVNPFFRLDLQESIDSLTDEGEALRKAVADQNRESENSLRVFEQIDIEGLSIDSDIKQALGRIQDIVYRMYNGIARGVMEPGAANFPYLKITAGAEGQNYTVGLWPQGLVRGERDQTL